MKKKVYWDVSSLFHRKLLDKKESLDLLAEKLKTNVNLYSSDAEKVLISLTGGFDGRTNLAVLDCPKEEFLCYSYGMPGSKQIKVPQEIAKITGVNYQSIILDQKFLDEYYENTLITSYFSNGTAPVGFCNIPYSYIKLMHYSDTIITGLFGSEVLRPLHNNRIQVNDQSFAIFLSDNFKSGIDKALNNINVNNYFPDVSLGDTKDELIDFFKSNYFEKYKNFEKTTIFFFFIIQEGIRKYFSQEISLERVYVTTRFPYFDTDFVNLIYKTPWAGMYNGFLGESKFKRRRGQLLYAHILKKYNPALGKIILDRGYRPDDLLLPFPVNFFKIGKGVLETKRYVKKVQGNDTFKTEIWAKETLEKITQMPYNKGNSILRIHLDGQLIDCKQPSSYLTYRHMASIRAFCRMIFQ